MPFPDIHCTNPPVPLSPPPQPLKPLEHKHNIILPTFPHYLPLPIHTLSSSYHTMSSPSHTHPLLLPATNPRHTPNHHARPLLDPNPQPTQTVLALHLRNAEQDDLVFECEVDAEVAVFVAG
ncbi:hypothetical protein K491DRAFT_237530 [Lophiostoma macrostomum CBS 122681]|uniref:Uncharacterized protein n=1 Tax=Lophiostoma macrostomum CBS 122681 TaxID=1314788 RepID=A0A6A6TJ27_9PLEO|nr:hypothetical protein K491DRAFT_237530 [Lophiostoma macrostomum CBS 122681]